MSVDLNTLEAGDVVVTLDGAVALVTLVHDRVAHVRWLSHGLLESYVVLDAPGERLITVVKTSKGPRS